MTALIIKEPCLCTTRRLKAQRHKQARASSELYFQRALKQSVTETCAHSHKTCTSFIDSHFAFLCFDAITVTTPAIRHHPTQKLLNGAQLRESAP